MVNDIRVSESLRVHESQRGENRDPERKVIFQGLIVQCSLHNFSLPPAAREGMVAM
jgi:hypothetical protein